VVLWWSFPKVRLLLGHHLLLLSEELCHHRLLLGHGLHLLQLLVVLAHPVLSVFGVPRVEHLVHRLIHSLRRLVVNSLIDHLQKLSL